MVCFGKRMRGNGEHKVLPKKRFVVNLISRA